MEGGKSGEGRAGSQEEGCDRRHPRGPWCSSLWAEILRSLGPALSFLETLPEEATLGNSGRVTLCLSPQGYRWGAV